MQSNLNLDNKRIAQKTNATNNKYSLRYEIIIYNEWYSYPPEKTELELKYMPSHLSMQKRAT